MKIIEGEFSSVSPFSFHSPSIGYTCGKFDENEKSAFFIDNNLLSFQELIEVDGRKRGGRRGG